MDFLSGISEGAVRFTAFVGIFFIMALLEFLMPKRELTHSKTHRWVTNIVIGGLDSLIVRLMGAFAIPIVAVAAAMWAEGKDWGFFNWTEWPLWLEILIAVLLLDLAIYGQHVASHKIPILWKVHRVHHSDVDFDVTTAIRFHPIEIALSMLYKVVLVLLMGPSALAVVIFEVLLNGTAMFNHANVALPRGLDQLLRLFVVTPDMHRVHHSIIRRETDSNYGFNLSIWDRMFRTYRPQPEKGHKAMTIGLEPHQSEAPTRLLWSLSFPFQAGSERDGENNNTKESPNQ